MSEHGVRIVWNRGTDAFARSKYSRVHEWRFDGGAVVRGSASPVNVPPGTADPAGVDPEEAFIAALSSCHMLWFLALASKAGFIVDSYDDDAIGSLTSDGKGGTAYFSRVTLRPKVVFSGKMPSATELDAIHHQAHDKCFIAASVKCEVVVESQH
jgi:organic hydroperoxide reductase OsmC/OhrA